MKNFIKYGLSIIVAALLIMAIKPFVDDYNEHKRYNFTINTFDGKISKDDFKGKALAVYFGYTSCPEVCPTTLTSLAQALDAFSKKKVKDFVAVFISVDSNKDTLKNLKDYAKYFHQNFIGGTSSEEEIAKIAKRYEVYYEKIPLDNSAMGYSIAHSSYIYLFDKNGKFSGKVNHFLNPSGVRTGLEKILN